MIHYVGRERRGNCWLCVAALLLSGRICSITLRWRRWIEFPHVLGVTWHGRLVHFKRTRGRPSRFGAWFRGRVQVYAVRSDGWPVMPLGS